jgi:hypothetical protein
MQADKGTRPSSELDFIHEFSLPLFKVMNKITAALRLMEFMCIPVEYAILGICAKYSSSTHYTDQFSIFQKYVVTSVNGLNDKLKGTKAAVGKGKE